MNIKLVTDKYRSTHVYTDIHSGVKVVTTNPDGTIVSRLISDEAFNEQIAYNIQNGYTIEVRDKE